MKLVVLDFDKGIVYVYNWDEEVIDIEEFLTVEGHRTSNCQWMLTKNDIITKQ